MTTTLIEQIAEALKSHDDQVLQSEIDSIPMRVEAMKKYRATAPRFVDSYKYYTGLYAAAGGKTWFNIINGRGGHDMIVEYLTNRHNASIEARNAKQIDEIASDDHENINTKYS